MSTENMDGHQPPDRVDSKSEDEEEDGLDWLLGRDSPEIVHAPMDTNILMSCDCDSNIDGISSKVFTRERVFEAASQGDAAELNGLLAYLRDNNKRLTSPEFTDEANGKTALLKALLNLKDGKNDTIEVLLDVAEKTGDLENFINASYKDPCYKGQTALHVAIERRSSDLVKLLVEKGADVQAKANGNFFQRNKGMGFYFGELPLSLAACTNQPEVVSFLMENNYRRADPTDKDSQGNTVLHTLVVIAEDTTENIDMISAIYDHILIQHNKLEKKKAVQLEVIENNKGLTPLKLAAKLGKIGLFKHMLHREFTDQEMKLLSRKLTEWVYGPVHSSLYDMTSIETDEHNSVLEIVVFGSDVPNRPEMLQIEPLRSLLQEKWDRFASKIFLINFLVYLLYVFIFTAVAFYRKKGEPPFPIENVTVDSVRCAGEVITILGGLYFFFKSIRNFIRSRPRFKALYMDGFSNILFFLQAALLLISAVLYFSGQREYVGILVLSLAFAWINVLHFLRGSRQMGMYSVMMQRMILVDLFHFLCVYSVLLLGFSAAIVALYEETPRANKKVTNSTLALGKLGKTPVKPVRCKKPCYNNIRFTILEMFKFTIGMGDLGFTDRVQYKEVFYILLILYIVLTYILLLNMLIALMGSTVESTSKESENIWNLQRAVTILEIEGTLPRCLRNKLYSSVSNVVCLKCQDDGNRRFFRVEEKNWKQWASDLGVIREEDPGDLIMRPQLINETLRSRWKLNPLLERIRARRHPPQHTSIP
ncbi:transient receptor potential cation channel subfamily V member 1-like [Cheilinus undulatus]|uniref:transient receptor potential cation channel subfamily V member 1-like n=1 Tax=Cheilinus undulatus TaxID=241271 RepID=UPI001BD2AF3B|nr:transient receptor potential cation channel subfamily V member 1-like [Cheilinus undulatus]